MYVGSWASGGLLPGFATPGCGAFRGLKEGAFAWEKKSSPYGEVAIDWL
jgi:hypothetical protein